MSQDPVATAAANNPLLTTLTAAISGKLNPGVNLVDTLNGGEFTVIAPTDDAFAKIDAGTAKLRGTADTLPDEPLTWRYQRETDATLLPQTRAFAVEAGLIAP